MSSRVAFALLVLLTPSETTTQLAAACGSSTCYGFDCDYWVLENDATCQELELDGGCDCSGCECGNSCPASCFDKTCDEWTTEGVACATLEAEFDCVCGGCDCNDPVTKPSTEQPSTTTTTTERIFSQPPDEGSFTGTIPLEVIHTTTHADCPPGHICDFGPPATQPPSQDDCVANWQGDGFCDDENNMQACDWDLGDCCGAMVQTTYCDNCECLDPALSAFYNCGNTTCVQPAWQSDSYCDDENNVCSCNWDGGDCCGSDMKYNYCTECKCKDVQFDGAQCHAGCTKQAWVGDDFCDDQNNNCGCNWDGGDCCGANKHATYCTECACLDPDEQVVVDSVNCVLGCENLAHFGDGFCDDYNNVCGCAWDGGDCCGGSVSFKYCDTCNCLDPNYVCPGDKTCEVEAWLNDKFCDDGNNNCGCNWDHGDCCGSENFYAHCTECECLDDAYLSLPCNGVCGIKMHKGDGFCDDSNNNCGCDWDGGDCCGAKTSSQNLYCTECQCLDPLYNNHTCEGSCAIPGYKGDGLCDDDNNICGCGWDGGDCCTLVQNARQYCTVCACLDIESPFFDTSPCADSCAHPTWEGDGHCDDNNNLCGCAWDGGDCCDSGNYTVNKAYCDTCACLDPLLAPIQF